MSDHDQGLRAEDFRRSWPHALSRMLQLAQEMIDQAEADRQAAEARAVDLSAAGERSLALALQVSREGIAGLRAASQDANAIVSELPEAARSAVRAASEEFSASMGDDLGRLARSVAQMTAIVASLEAERSARIQDREAELHAALQTARAEVRQMGLLSRLRFALGGK